ncbi:hypothetical protein Btru_071646 [Bulinus truncatus]|nr:hypothetical protein Btru_071646 [Bulinus truncatus]
MEKYRLHRVLYFLAIIYLQVNALEVNSSISYPAGNVVGNKAIVQCQWNVSENPDRLILSSHASNPNLPASERPRSELVHQLPSRQCRREQSHCTMPMECQRKPGQADPLIPCIEPVIRLKTVFTSTIIYLQVNALEVNSSISYPAGNVVGNKAIVQCQWNVSENPDRLILSSHASNPLFDCDMIGQINCSSGSSQAVRRHSVNWTTLGSLSVAIDDVGCSDEGEEYRCAVSKGVQSSVSTSTMNLRVLPTPPKLSDVIMSAPENENLTATCTAILGYPRPLDIVWRAFKNGQSVDLQPKLIFNEVIDSEPGDDKCTIRRKSTVYLKAEKDHQDLILACFIANQDFQPTLPNFCKNPTTDLCSQTNPVTVTQPVNTSFPSSSQLTVSRARRQATAGRIKLSSLDTEDCDKLNDRCGFCAKPDCTNYPLLAAAAILSLLIVILLTVLIVMNRRIKAAALAKSRGGTPSPDVAVHSPV